MAMPQCCYLAKGAKRPSHTTNTIKFDRIPFDPCNSIKRFDLSPFDQKNSTYLQPPRKFSHRISTIVYCRREGSSCIFEELVSTGILVIPAAKNLISKRKQKNRWLQENLGEVHLAKSVERRFIHTILKRSGNLKYIVKRKRPSKKRSQRKGKPRKRPSKKKSK